MSEARQEILGRIAAAVGEQPAQPSELPASSSYRRAGSLAAEERVALFCRRVGEYRAEVHRVACADLAKAITTVCAARDAVRLVVPPGLPSSWRAADLDLVDGHELPAPDLDRVDGALTGCTVAIAETGTIVLSGSPAEGRRALSLVPDLHVCVVGETQIVELLPEALAMIAAAGLERRPITFISGPSATSDIELSRVEGVHGPRNLVVLVVEEAS